MRSLALTAIICLSMTRCAVAPAESAADLNAAFDVASAGAAAYAAQPGSNPQTLTEIKQLLAAAQAALVSWTNSPSPNQQAAVSAAIAALVAYEAGTKPS